MGFCRWMPIILVCLVPCIHGNCRIRDNGIPISINEGYEWKDTCDTCRCMNGKVVCSGGPNCPIPHSDTLSYTCLKWSADKCCCLKQGCVGFDDKEYKFGDYMPMNASGCQKCLCSDHMLTAKCFFEKTDACSKEKHDHPFSSDHLHSHIKNK